MAEVGKVEVIAATSSANLEPKEFSTESEGGSGGFDTTALLGDQVEWRTISERFPGVIPAGATCNVVSPSAKSTRTKAADENDKVLFIGGSSHSNKGLYLSVSVFSFKDFDFTSQFMETNRIINRLGHSSVNYEDKVLCFGGVSTQTGMPLGQVISVELNKFGIKSQLMSYNENISGTGLSTDLYGMKKDQIIIFGGQLKDSYSNTITKFRPNHETPADDRFSCVQIAEATEEAPHPTPRAYHSSAICGSKNQFLVILGGRAKTGSLLDDIWVVDLSSVDDANKVAEEEEVTNAKKPPPKKGKPPVEDEHQHCCRWRKIEVTDPQHIEILSRSLHSACRLPSNRTSEEQDTCISIAIFNGISKCGLPYVCGYHLDIDMVNYCLTTCEVISARDACTFLPGSCSILEKNSRGEPSMIAVISGDSLHYLSLDISSEISKTLLNMTSREVQLEETKHQEEEKHRKETEIPTKKDYDTGEQYRGDLIEDPNVTDSRSFLRDGQGEMIYMNGMSYRGSWERDLKHGIGTLTFPYNLGSYEGDFLHGCMEGKGKINLSPGCKEKGGSDCDFIADTYINANDGFTYEGNFVQGKLHGYGILETSCGDKYEGNFQGGRFSGAGKLENKDGSRYCGKFVLGLKNDDHATLTYPDQSTYEGSFRSDKRNGHGILISSKGKTIYKGKWVGDKFCGAGEWNTPMNERYLGAFEEGYPSGKGILYHTNGSVYTGEFRNGKKEGMGKTVYADGTVEEGMYSRDKLVVF